MISNQSTLTSPRLPPRTALRPAEPRRQGLGRRILDNRQIYVLFLPWLLFFVIFKYAPMWMLVVAFENYSPFAGVWKSEWVGLAHFKELLTDPRFYVLLRNTLAINVIKLLFYLPAPILLALMLNEVRHDSFKRINQTVVYLPHFLSWVVVASMAFDPEGVGMGDHHLSGCDGGRRPGPLRSGRHRRLRAKGIY